MATLKQYEFFKGLYDEQTERTHELREQGKTYISLSTLYSAFVTFVVERVRPETILDKSLFVLTVASMVAAFFASLWAIKVSNFEAITFPQDVVEEMGDSAVKDAAFFDKRIGDYAVACERNSKVNDLKARQVQVAGVLLLLGILLHALYVIAVVS
ncbi:hypothetical protein [Bradyrhizobium sp. SZCCHNR2026]|uniref:hypothetical protein n=1 Tax=Bradyrhizobium sp. SZCCHNR2026 TaxID=3057381 RepID=UPI002916C61C|nr:hypothetical protein [Bradyrhizobium sp. SZCCHNR2026]